MYDGERLRATGSVQYIRDSKRDAEQILDRLYEMTTNQSTMSITKRTRFTFRCEDKKRKYMFKVANGSKPSTAVAQEVYL